MTKKLTVVDSEIEAKRIRDMYFINEGVCDVYIWAKKAAEAAKTQPNAEYIGQCVEALKWAATILARSMDLPAGIYSDDFPAQKQSK